MRYFQKIAAGVNVLPLAHALARQPNLWNGDMVRTGFEGSPHREVDDIILRYGKPEGNGTDLMTADRIEMQKFPYAKKLALDLMSTLGGSQLGRIVISRLAPGGKILSHRDAKGAYAEFYGHYHVVLQGLPGSLFSCGDETVNMVTGDVWYFDASAEHAVMNNSQDDRIHLLVDIRTDP